MPTRDDLIAFGSTLKAARLRRDRMSQDKLADQLKARGHQTTGANIGGWERGEYAPSDRRIVDVLDDILETEGALHAAIGWVRTAGQSSQDYNSRITKLPATAQAFIDEYIANEERKKQS